MNFNLFDTEKIFRENLVKLGNALSRESACGGHADGACRSFSQNESNKMMLKTKYPFGKCKICNDQATGVHYGVPTCEGCKVTTINLSFFFINFDSENILNIFLFIYFEVNFTFAFIWSFLSWVAEKDLKRVKDWDYIKKFKYQSRFKIILINLIISTKGFFKRSILKKEKYSCFFNNKCEITPQHRNRCKACRFDKCLAEGMSMQGTFFQTKSSFNLNCLNELLS